MKNLFLSGKRRVGKSTAIKRALEIAGIDYGGFFTYAVLEQGNIKGFNIRNILSQEEALIGYFDGNFSIHAVKEGFETVGVNAVRNAVESSCPLIVMDELGFLEEEALAFQEEVLKALRGSKLVFGAIKEERNSFLEKIAELSCVIEIDEVNRNSLPEELGRLLWEYTKTL